MKVLRYLLLALVTLSLHSCDNFTEEIHLKEDGSGAYKIYFDMIPSIRKMAVEMSAMMGDSSAKQVDEQAIEQYIWKDFPEGEIDSVFEYSEAEDQELLNDPKKKELYSRMKGFMYGGKEKGYLYTGVKFEFRDLADLQNLTKTLEDKEKKKNSKGSTDAVKGLDDLKTETKYQLKTMCLHAKRKSFQNRR